MGEGVVEEVEEEEEGGEGEGEEGGVDVVVAVDAGSYGYLLAEEGDTTSMMTTKTGGQNHSCFLFFLFRFMWSSPRRPMPKPTATLRTR